MTIKKNGDIIFVYKLLPKIEDIRDAVFPVRIEVSDAIVLNETDGITNLINPSYHEASLRKKLAIKTLSISKLCLPAINTTPATAKALCCAWCSVVSRCSDGSDRNRHK